MNRVKRSGSVLNRVKRSGFTLTEVLTAALIGASVCLAALQIAMYVSDVMERSAARTLAWERGENALSIIGPRVMNAALGVTYRQAGDLFRRSFGNGSNSPPPSRWTDRGPLQILDWRPALSLAPMSGGLYMGSGLAVLYAMPSGLWAVMEDGKPIVLSSGESAPIRLAPDEELRAAADWLPTTNRGDLRAWAAFPLTRLPLYAVHSPGGVTVQLAKGEGLSAAIYPYDEMHYLRAEQFYAQKGVMYSKELRTSWTYEESRLEGVLAMWFEWNPSEKLLKAWILTTGGKAVSGKSARPEEWPPQAKWEDEGFDAHEAAVTRASWRLRNI